MGLSPSDGTRAGTLKSRIRIQADSLRRLADKLTTDEDFPSEAPRKLCRLISATACLVEKYLDKTPDDHLEHAADLICTIAEDLRYAERSRTTQTPWSMVQAVEVFLKAQVGDTYAFILRPQWSYNYGIVGDFVEYMRGFVKACPWIPMDEWERQAGIDSPPKQKIFCISFPRLDRLNCLGHTSWGHEVGHILVTNWMEKHFLPLWLKEATRVRTEIGKSVSVPDEIGELFKGYYRDQVVADRYDKATQAAQQGLTELLCDAIGVRLFGPAALASLIEYSSARSLDESPLSYNFYPPWRHRLRTAINACKEDLAALRELAETSNTTPGGDLTCSPFLNWLHSTEKAVLQENDRRMLRGDVVTKEAYRFIDDQWEGIREAVLNALPAGARPYRLAERMQTVAALIEKLRSDVPPNEESAHPDDRPAEIEDILNAGWIFKLYLLANTPENEQPEAIGKLYRLVLKAIEAAFVHRQFQQKAAGREGP